jgi:hypothetical protein
MIRRWLRRRRCFHHDYATGESWIGRGQIIDLGRGKLYRCNHCERTWIK